MAPSTGFRRGFWPPARRAREWADATPNLAGDKDGAASHYKVTFRRGRRQFTTYFSMGAAHTKEPTAAEVLDCLASDVSGFQNAGSFESWCDEYGYDHDSGRPGRT